MNKEQTFYKQFFHLQEAGFSRIAHEDAMVADVYKVTQKDKEPLILKICSNTNDYLREIYFLKHFADILPVPKIIKTEPKAILMEYLPGELLNSKDLTESLAFELGRCLAIIHSNSMSGYGDPVGELSSDPQEYFTFKFEEGLEECRPNLPPKLIEKCRSYFENHRDLLKSVDGPCVVHRDFRPGNIMIHRGKLQGIIDWAGARASFAEEDLFSIDGWTKSSFFSGYASIRPLPNFAPLIPFLKLNKAIATIGFMVKRGTWNTTHTDLYQMHRKFLDLCES